MITTGVLRRDCSTDTERVWLVAVPPNQAQAERELHKQDGYSVRTFKRGVRAGGLCLSVTVIVARKAIVTDEIEFVDET